MDRCIKTNRSDRWTGVSRRILVIGEYGRIEVIGGQVYKDQ